MPVISTMPLSRISSMNNMALRITTLGDLQNWLSWIGHVNLGGECNSMQFQDPSCKSFFLIVWMMIAGIMNFRVFMQANGWCRMVKVQMVLNSWLVALARPRLNVKSWLHKGMDWMHPSGCSSPTEVDPAFVSWLMLHPAIDRFCWLPVTSLHSQWSRSDPYL